MKNRLLLTLALVFVSPAAFSMVPDTTDLVAFPPVSPPVAQLLKLIHANIPEDIAIAYVENAPYTFDPTPEEIIQLENEGVDPNIIKEIFLHDRELREAANAPYNNGGFPAFENQSQFSSPDVPPTPPPTEQPETFSQPAGPPPTDPSQFSSGEDDSQAANFFYSSLAPYGSWQNSSGSGSSGSGMCWQPYACQNRGWKPYCDQGQWFFTDSGWYWNSYYPWGWAPFHYGRWSNDPKLGWVWFPGKQWSPAWVTWRDSGKAIGWAPLPPFSKITPNGLVFSGRLVPPGFGFSLKRDDYVFVLPRNFSEVDLRSKQLDRAQASDVFPDTRPVNNCSIGPDGHVLNQGLDVNLVAGDSEKPIIRAHLQDAHDLKGANYSAGASGSPATLGIFRPQVTPPPSPFGPAQFVAHNNLPFATEGRMGTANHNGSPFGSPQNFQPESSAQPQTSSGQPQTQSQPFNFHQEASKVLSQHNATPMAPAGTQIEQGPNGVTQPGNAPAGTQFWPSPTGAQHGAVAPGNVVAPHFSAPAGGAPAGGGHK